jgi:hypothetical protein
MKFNVTVTNISSITIEASSEQDARRMIDTMLATGDINLMTEINECSSGWEITDCDENT